MFSLGCILAELYCGHPIFPALDENELLEFHIRLCGPVPDHLIEDSTKHGKLFYIDNQNGQFKVIKSPNSRLEKIKGINYLNLE
jgi:hypothetical protein